MQYAILCPYTVDRFTEVVLRVTTTEQRIRIERGYLFLPGSSMGVLRIESFAHS
jgi:hypothetical protein